MKQHSTKRVAALLATCSAILLSQHTKAAGPPPPTGGPPPPVLLELEILGAGSLDENTSASYTCLAKYSDLTSEEIFPNWSENSEFIVIDSSGEVIASSVNQDELVTITASYNGKSAAAELLVRDVPPVVSGLIISGPSNLVEGTTGSYSCVALYSDGSSQGVTPTWGVSSSSATISTGGILTAGDIAADESLFVTADFDGQSAQVSVLITYVPPVLTEILIQGGSAMDEESSMQLNCIGLYSDGSTALIVPAWAENSAYATISSSGLLSAGNIPADETVTVSAVYNSISTTKTILMRYVEPTLSSIEIAGPSALSEESSATYSCTAHYSDGTSQSVQPNWNENSAHASISSGGVLTTDNITADRTLTVSASFGGISDSISVTILYVEPTLTGIEITGPVILDEGVSVQYSCVGYYSDGTTEPVAPQWSVDSNLVQIDGAGLLLAGDVIEDTSVTISAAYGGELDQLPVLVKYVPPPVVLVSLTISGPTELEEFTSGSFACQASYSDGTTAMVVPEWSVDQVASSMNIDGVLTAGNVETDTVIKVTASFGGISADYDVTVWSVSSRIVYPLTGFEGKTVKAELYDEKTGGWFDLGTSEGPEELVIENVNTGQWYWVSVLESNAVSNVWDEVHANWLHM